MRTFLLCVFLVLCASCAQAQCANGQCSVRRTTTAYAAPPTTVYSSVAAYQPRTTYASYATARRGPVRGFFHKLFSRGN